MVLVHLSALHDAMGESIQAAEAMQKALHMLKADKPTNMLVNIYNNLAIVYKDMGDYANALHHAQMGLEFARQLKHHILESAILCTIGEIQIDTDSDDEAKVGIDQGGEFRNPPKA